MRLALVVVFVPAIAFAQQPQDPYATMPPAATAPTAAPAATAPTAAAAAAATPPRPRGARLTLATRSMDVAQLVTACANAIDNDHVDVARKKCGEAMTKEDSLAFAHYLLAQAEAPDVANRELQRASELAKTSSRGEQLFIEGWRAMVQARTADAKKAYDELVKLLPGEARALVARGRFELAALENADAAAADFGKAVEIDAKYPAAYGLLALAESARGQNDAATAAAKKYVEQAPNEPNAFVTVARVALQRGATDEAIAQAKKALAVDGSFVVADAVLGDALLFAGKGKEARKAYAALIATDDPQIHHDGAMREARSWLFDGRFGDGERALSAEADLSAKTKRPGDQADALVELARVQLDRGALAEAGQSLRHAREALEPAENVALMAETERRRLSAEAMHVRAMVLAAVGERQIADQRANEMAVVLELAGDPRAGRKATALKGWIAARNGDDKAALGMLAQATRPTLKLAYALALVRAKQLDTARGLFDQLARRPVNDLEGALTRPRAAAWVKSHADATAQQ